MDTEQLHRIDKQYVLGTYARAPFELVRGQGVYLYDSQDRAYLDFVSGIAVNALGYGDPEVVAAITAQAAQLMHVSNLYLTAPQAELAQMLCEHSFADKVYFCNSGTESVEAAIKFARKWAGTHKAGATEFIGFTGAFHGRTMGALALTPRAHYQDAFRPLMPGAKLATFGDLSSVEALVDDNTCAIIVEPLQGEGGVNPADPSFLVGLRELCTRANVLLIVDEVQCGLGRTGTLWAHEFYGITPDLMTLAKPLGGGLPMGATLLTQAVADTIGPGDHASTFAANPVICAASKVVVKRIAEPKFLAHVRWAGDYLKAGLDKLAAKYPVVTEVRGRGLIWGVEAKVSVAPAVQYGYDHGLLVLNAGPNVLRLIPPLVVEQTHLDEALAMLDGAIGCLR